VPLILEALEAAGCTEALEITREVLSVLQLPPTFTEAELMAATEAFTGDSGSAFDAWDSRYYAEVGDLSVQVVAFIRKNLPHVRVP
jgi:hypothetical protein